MICGLMITGTMAQEKRYAVIRKASVAPVIDGQVDDVWAEADPENNIDRAQVDEIPTLGEPGETTWQALWDRSGIYLLLRVTDDDFYPNYEAGGGNRWDYDSPEIYFDVNSDLLDGIGPMDGDGHYQFAPEFDPSRIDGTEITEGNGVRYAFLVDDPNYKAEYFFPFSYLVDVDGYSLDQDLERDIGFDISLHDRDLGDDSLRVGVWCNIGAAGDSWSNMDDCGIINLDETSIEIIVEKVNLTGGEITENNGTLQIDAVVLPENASEKGLTWTIENTTGKATIDLNGVVTAAVDGEVKVTATATDGSWQSGETTVIITGQIVTMKDLNEIRNPNFDQVGGSGMPTDYTFYAPNPDPAPQVLFYETTLVCTPGEWEVMGKGNYQIRQSNLHAEADAEYIYRFLAYADDTRPIMTNFEDTGNEWARYGVSDDERCSWGNVSDWSFDITAEPTWYEFIVTFPAANMNNNTVQSVSFQLGESAVVVYLDSLQLARTADYGQIEEYIPVQFIGVSSEGDADRVTLDATLQMSAEVLPLEADYPGVKWSVVNGTGAASIDQDGLLTPDSAGVGKVTVVASAVDDSDVKGELEVTVSWAAGISEAGIHRIKVFPNPASSELNIMLDRENSTISIYNSAGVKLDEVEIRGTEYRLDISDYAPGIYYIRTGNGVTKFVR